MGRGGRRLLGEGRYGVLDSKYSTTTHNDAGFHRLVLGLKDEYLRCIAHITSRISSLSTVRGHLGCSLQCPPDSDHNVSFPIPTLLCALFQSCMTWTTGPRYICLPRTTK